MRKLDYENTPSIAVDPAEDPSFGAVGDAIKSRPAEFVRALGERLYLIGANIQLFSDPHARADLLALDPQGRAVVIVVERPGEHSLLERGLMCAGLVAGWKPEFFFRYPAAGKASKLRGFLRVQDEEVNREQRVVLVAHSHEYAIFSASQWLAQQHGIEIWCVQGRLKPETDQLELVRLEPASFRPGDPVETVRVVFPHPSGDAAGDAGRDLAPLEPALAPLLGSATGACRLRTIWQPAAGAVPKTADAIEHRAGQILAEEPLAPVAQPPEPQGPDSQQVETKAAEPAGAEETAVPWGRHAACPDLPAPGTDVEEPAGKGSEPPDGPETAPRLGKEPAPEATSAESPADEAPLPKPQTGEETPPDSAPAAQPRRRFRIVGLMSCVTILAVAGLLVVSLPTPPHPDPPESVAEPAPPPPATPLKFRGTVLDRATGRPISGARIYYAGHSFDAGDSGSFEVETRGQERSLLVKAPGYRQTRSSLDDSGPIRLEPLDVRGYYVSAIQMADPARRESIVELIRGTKANAVVLGVKDVNGRISVPVDHSLARELQSAEHATRIGLRHQVSAWKKEGIYTIALVALFKDDLLARTKPDLALLGIESRQPVIDADNIAWADPSAAAVREYNLAVAEAAALAGFDEIHFDFIRYSSEGRSTEGGGRAEYQRRLDTLVRFLSDANKLLAPHNVYISASVFGSVCVMPRASVIGQKIEEFAEQVDYLAPMLYPSYFEPGKRFPVPLRHAYQLVHESLLRAAHRLEGQSVKLRPWLQNFPDRASPNVPLHAHSIFGQVKAAEDARTSGWMLWDARGLYRNTTEAITMLNSDRRSDQRTDSGVSGGDGDGDGGSVVPVIDTVETFEGGPPTASTGDRFRLVAVLVLVGLFLAVLYGALRAAWLFHEWNRTGPPSRLPRQQAAPVARKWLTRPQFLRGLPHVRPR